MKNNTLLVDGSSLLKNCYFGVKGDDEGGIYQFLYHIRKITKDKFIDKIIICWDEKLSGLLKKEIYSKYKDNRKKDWVTGERLEINEDDIRIDTQKKILKKICFHLHFYQIYDNVTEADDIIAEYVNNSNDNCVIITGDSDILQLLENKNTQIYYLHKNKEKNGYYDHLRFEKVFGYNIKNLWFIKTLCGDSADNISGLKGMGKKTLEKNFNLIKPITKKTLLENNNQKILDFIRSNDYVNIKKIVSLKKPIISENIKIEIKELYRNKLKNIEDRDSKDLFLILNSVDFLSMIKKAYNSNYINVKNYKSFFKPFLKIIKKHYE